MSKFLKAMDARIAELGGEDVAVFERIANGDKIAEIAESIGCSRPFMYVWKKRKAHRDRLVPKWDEAMRVRAMAKAEEGEDILDALEEKPREEITSARVALAKERANYKRWLASKLDPDQYGDQNGPQVAINVQALHLQALKAVNAAHALPAPVVEAEWEEASG